MDDTFALFDNVASATRFLQYLNTRHPNINFTIEFEENHEIPFLDVRVKRNLNTFTTTVHRKTTFTGLYTKWDSFTPRKYKINLIRTLTYRCLRICSSSFLLQSALFDLKKTSEWLPERRALLQHESCFEQRKEQVCRAYRHCSKERYIPCLAFFRFPK